MCGTDARPSAREGSQQGAINGQGGGGDPSNMGSFFPFQIPRSWALATFHGEEKQVHREDPQSEKQDMLTGGGNLVC